MGLILSEDRHWSSALRLLPENQLKRMGWCWAPPPPPALALPGPCWFFICVFYCAVNVEIIIPFQKSSLLIKTCLAVTVGGLELRPLSLSSAEF